MVSTFQERLAIGHQWEVEVCKRLNDSGLMVFRPQQSIEQWGFAMHQIDLVCVGVQPSYLVAPRVIEVKSVALSFTNRSDFPYSTVMFSNASVWAQKTVKPLITIVVSQLTGAILSIPTDTKSRWDIKDTKQGTQIVAPIEHCLEWGDTVRYITDKMLTTP